MSQPPGVFAASINDFESYPENLIHRTTYLGALKAHKTQLDTIEKRLFTQKACDINVAFRDFRVIESGPEVEKEKIFDDEKLQQRLGEASRTFSNGIVSREDPKCRFIFIRAEHSRAPLKISRRMLVRVLSYYQVIPSYIDFLLVFGGHKHTREKRFSGFHSQIQLEYTPSLAVDYLGRSGRQFQLCYNLKSVGRWTESGHLTPRDDQWSFRQGAFHHQFDVLKGTALWIITRADLDLKERIEETTGKTGRSEDRQFQTPEQCLKSSLAIHLLLCHWASENWRTYFQWLEDTVEDETYLLVYNPRGHDEYQQKYSTGHLQEAQNLEEQTNEAVMVLEGNIGVLAALRSFYHELGGNDQFPLRNNCNGDLSSFTKQIDSFIYDSKMHIARGQLIAKIIAARKTIILQHFQSQATEKMEQLTTSMQRDSLTVRIIAFLTFIYLPATFVSTFFSTDVVKYQNQNSISTSDASGPTKQTVSFSAIALNRWLQVTLPLTFLTFATAVLWLWREDRKLRRVYQELPIAEPKSGGP